MDKPLCDMLVWSVSTDMAKSAHLISERWMAKEVLTVCELCEQLGYRWAVCSACGIEFRIRPPIN